jgi:hypothetical protein
MVYHYLSANSTTKLLASEQVDPIEASVVVFAAE